MTFTGNSPSDAPLGVGSIVGDSFTILFRHFFSVMVLAIIPTLIGVVASGLLIGFDATLGRSEPVFSGGADILRFLLTILGQIVAYSLTVGLLVQLAYDAKLGRPLQAPLQLPFARRAPLRLRSPLRLPFANAPPLPARSPERDARSNRGKVSGSRFRANWGSSARLWRRLLP